MVSCLIGLLGGAACSSVDTATLGQPYTGAGGSAGTSHGGTGGSAGTNYGGTGGGTGLDASTGTETASAHAAPAVDGGLAIPALAICSDGQVAAIASAANRAEIAEARAIVNATDTPSVKSFATRMIEDHGRLDAAAAAILEQQGIAPVENGLSREIEKSSQSAIDEFGSLRGRERDAAYIDHEMLAHAQVLATLDSILLPSVKNAELHAALLDARQVVATHLELAARVQEDVEGACGGGVAAGAGTGGAGGCDGGKEGTGGAAGSEGASY
jgi:putative membrane protein